MAAAKKKSAAQTIHFRVWAQGRARAACSRRMGQTTSPDEAKVNCVHCQAEMQKVAA